MESHKRFSPATLTLASLAAFFAGSMALFAVGLGDWMLTAFLAWPGAFLAQSYGFAAVYIPFVLGALAWISHAPQVSVRVLIPVGLSIVPFMTLAVLGQTLDPHSASPAAEWALAQMGAAAPAFLAIFTVFEIAVGALGTVALYRALGWTGAEERDSETSMPNDAELAAQRYQTLRNALWSTEDSSPAEESEARAEASEPAAQTASEPPTSVGEAKPQTATETSNDWLRVPHIREWNTERALRDEPSFASSSEDDFRSPALDALTRTLAGMPVEETEPQAEGEGDDDGWIVEHDEIAEMAAAFDQEVNFYADEVPVVDWDSLAGPAHDDDDDDEDENDEFDAFGGEETIQVLSQPSALIRPLEGGNFPVKTVHVLPSNTADSLLSRAQESRKPEEESTPEESGHWAQRPHFKSWSIPVEGILTTYKEGNFSEIDEATKRAGHILKMTLKEFNIDADVTGIRKGPVVTMFELLPAAGVKLSKIVALADNIALGLAATSIRIVAPIPGKHAVGIEVPNKERTLVGFAEMINSREFQESQAAIPMVLGKDISGDAQIIDLTRTPHLLIAGATGAGKSVSVNTLVCSILYRRSPDEVKLLMIDPKIVELKFFNDIPHLLAPVITDPKKALQAVQWCLYEMERRYALLDAIGAKDIRSYNSKIEKRHIATNKLPYIVLVIDEFADLMAASGKDLEGTIARLAAMSRAVGIHLVLATQRPSVDVITGLIKANFPSRVAFQVASKTDSRIIIDQMGAEKLLGRGDMLFTSSWNPFPNRIQGAFLSEDDVERVVSYVKTLGEPDYISDEIFFDEEAEEAFDAESAAEEMDPLFEKAIEIVRTFKKASASFLQRRLGVGYNRAARMIEMMEEMGIVGPQNGSKPREIVHA